MAQPTHFIFRRCITLKNGKRICMPPGRAFRIPVNDNDKPPKDKQATV
jgi:hypothetical protein